MKLENIRFPLYVVHSDEVLRRDGVLWVDGAVLDDTNVHGESLGERRLRTPLKNMYDLKHQIDNFGGLIKHRGRFYIDSNGKFFIYEKSKKATLKYHLIRKVEQKDIVTLIWIQNIPFPFEVPRPPHRTELYAGILYISGKPAYLYELSTKKCKDTWRKI
jgi:hypothetical protein